MSTFRAFQTGLEAGQKQAKVKREDDARMKASEAFGSGNYEGAVSSLMGVGLMDDANAYGQAGERKKEAERTEAYATAFKTGLGAGPAPDRRAASQAVATEAGNRGDFATMESMLARVDSLDDRQRTQFGEGMKFLGDTARGLVNVSPEKRAEEAKAALQNTPYADPQVMAMIDKAGEDGLITDQELQRFVDYTMTAAERAAANKPADLPEGMWYGQDGKGPPQPIPGYVNMRTQIARGSQSPTAGGDTYRPATAEDRAKWGLPPEGAFKINERTGEPAAISGARAAQDFSPTEIRGFRDQADGLYILQNAVNQYVTMLEKMGGPQLLDTPLNATNTQALKSAHGLITEAIKDAGKLGALDQGVQNLVNAIIQEPVGFGTFGKSTESIKQAANQLNSSIEFKLSRVPEEYRAGSTGAVPDFEGDDDDFIDTLFEPAPSAPASSRATPMATVNPGASTGRFHRGNDPRQTQRPTAPRPQPAARQPIQSQQLPPGVTPEMWAVMDDEDKAAFQQ